MLKIFLHLLLSTLAIIVVSKIVPGFVVDNMGAALIAAIVIGIFNATFGLVLKIVTLPLTILTLGIFWFVINAIMIELASGVVAGFHVANFGSAFLGAFILSLLNVAIRHFMKDERKTHIL